jgi:hypothetical protein
MESGNKRKYENIENIYMCMYIDMYIPNESFESGKNMIFKFENSNSNLDIQTAKHDPSSQNGVDEGLESSGIVLRSNLYVCVYVYACMHVCIMYV